MGSHYCVVGKGIIETTHFIYCTQKKKTNFSPEFFFLTESGVSSFASSGSVCTAFISIFNQVPHKARGSSLNHT